MWISTEKLKTAVKAVQSLAKDSYCYLTIKGNSLLFFNSSFTVEVVEEEGIKVGVGDFDFHFAVTIANLSYLAKLTAKIVKEYSKTAFSIDLARNLIEFDLQSVTHSLNFKLPVLEVEDPATLPGSLRDELVDETNFGLLNSGLVSLLQKCLKQKDLIGFDIYDDRILFSGPKQSSCFLFEPGIETESSDYSGTYSLNATLLTNILLAKDTEGLYIDLNRELFLSRNARLKISCLFRLEKLAANTHLPVNKQIFSSLIKESPITFKLFGAKELSKLIATLKPPAKDQFDLCSVSLRKDDNTLLLRFFENKIETNTLAFSDVRLNFESIPELTFWIETKYLLNLLLLANDEIEFSYFDYSAPLVSKTDLNVTFVTLLSVIA